MCPSHRGVSKRIGLHMAPGARPGSELDPDAHSCPHTGNQGGAIVPRFPLPEAHCPPAERGGSHRCQHSLHLTPSPASSSQDSHLPEGWGPGKQRESKSRLWISTCLCPLSLSRLRSVSLPPYTQTHTHTHTHTHTCVHRWVWGPASERPPCHLRLEGEG